MKKMIYWLKACEFQGIPNLRVEDGIPDFMDGIPDFMEKVNTF